VDYPEMHMDAVRVGKLLHGFWPQTKKRPFESEYPFKLRSEIVALRNMRLGESLGYGLKYVCRDNDLIALVPIGYADGYTRLYLGKTFALVRGARVPVVGSICCDQIFLKVTSLSGVEIGDEVILIGRQGDQEITADELGAMI
jgi:alanine racemase